MPRQRFYNLAPKSRRKLLDVASKHFAEHGFERASLNTILSEAGLSKGSYYYYFDDKDDLFATALESAVDDVLARLPMPSFDTTTADEFWPTVERFVSKWAGAFDASSDLLQAALQLTEAQRKSPRFAPMFAKGQAIYRTIIESGRRLGCVRADLPVESLVRLVEAVDFVLDSIFLQAHPRRTRKSLDPHMRLVFDTFKRLLVTDPFGAREKPRTHDG